MRAPTAAGPVTWTPALFPDSRLRSAAVGPPTRAWAALISMALLPLPGADWPVTSVPMRRPASVTPSAPARTWMAAPPNWLMTSPRTRLPSLPSASTSAEALPPASVPTSSTTGRPSASASGSRLASSQTVSVRMGSAERGVMVWAPSTSGAGRSKRIVSAPGCRLAWVMASRSEPVPLSAVVLTTKVLPMSPRLASAAVSAAYRMRGSSSSYCQRRRGGRVMVSSSRRIPPIRRPRPDPGPPGSARRPARRGRRCLSPAGPGRCCWPRRSPGRPA